jgi:hypothetical protein
MPIPTTEAINPTESVVLSILAGMDSSIDSRSASGKYGARRRHKPADVHHICVSAAAAHLRCEQTR